MTEDTAGEVDVAVNVNVADRTCPFALLFDGSCCAFASEGYVYVIEPTSAKETKRQNNERDDILECT